MGGHCVVAVGSVRSTQIVFCRNWEFLFVHFVPLGFPFLSLFFFLTASSFSLSFLATSLTNDSGSFPHTTLATKRSVVEEGEVSGTIVSLEGVEEGVSEVVELLRYKV